MAADDVAYFAQSTPALFFWARAAEPLAAVEGGRGGNAAWAAELVASGR
jgi:hypothetical protein